MKVSIILPISFNYSDAERSIISCLKPNLYKNIEILICLNGNKLEFNQNLIKKFKVYKNKILRKELQ